jgi:hypothetical protein
MDITGKPTSESYTIYTNWDGVTEVYQSNSVTWQITGPNVPACVTALNKAYPSPAFNLLTDCKIGTPWNHCKL